MFLGAKWPSKRLANTKKQLTFFNIPARSGAPLSKVEVLASCGASVKKKVRKAYNNYGKIAYLFLQRQKKMWKEVTPAKEVWVLPHAVEGAQHVAVEMQERT